MVVIFRVKSEDDYRTGCQNVSHCQQQQSYSGLNVHPDNQTQPTILLLFLINIYDIMPWFVAIDEKGLLCQSRNHFKWQGCRSTLGVKQGKSIIQ